MVVVVVVGGGGELALAAVRAGAVVVVGGAVAGASSSSRRRRCGRRRRRRQGLRPCSAGRSHARPRRTGRRCPRRRPSSCPAPGPEGPRRRPRPCLRSSFRSSSWPPEATPCWPDRRRRSWRRRSRRSRSRRHRAGRSGASSSSIPPRVAHVRRMPGALPAPGQAKESLGKAYGPVQLHCRSATAHSSSGLGHRPLTAAARVRIPYGPAFAAPASADPPTEVTFEDVFPDRESVYRQRHDGHDCPSTAYVHEHGSREVVHGEMDDYDKRWIRRPWGRRHLSLTARSSCSRQTDIMTNASGDRFRARGVFVLDISTGIP